MPIHNFPAFLCFNIHFKLINLLLLGLFIIHFIFFEPISIRLKHPPFTIIFRQLLKHLRLRLANFSISIRANIIEHLDLFKLCQQLIAFFLNMHRLLYSWFIIRVHLFNLLFNTSHFLLLLLKLNLIAFIFPCVNIQ
jgi:hypothetical protein